VSERFELADETPGGSLGVAALVVVAAEVVVELAGREHVPAGGEDRMTDGDRSAAVAPAGVQAAVLGRRGRCRSSGWASGSTSTLLRRTRLPGGRQQRAKPPFLQALNISQSAPLIGSIHGQDVAFGVVVILVMLLLPTGFAGLLQRIALALSAGGRFRQSKTPRSAPEPPV
jgi:hypothetical protein